MASLLWPRRPQSWREQDRRPKAPRFCEDMPRCRPCFLPHRPLRKRKIYAAPPTALTPQQAEQAARRMGLL